MTSVVPPFCSACARWQMYDPASRETGSCEAFPGGIPAEIQTGEADHRFPHPGDNGLRFVLRDDWTVAQFDGLVEELAYYRP